MEGRTFLRLLFFISLMGTVAGLMMPFLIEELLDIDAYKAQKRAEIVVEQAAKWYIINNGPPDRDLNTEECKAALMPDYLNRWPGKDPIECTIQTDGQVKVHTRRDEQQMWLKKMIDKLLGKP